jgi:prophage regulatory protein
VNQELLSIKEVHRRVKLSASTINRYVAAGSFPKPIKLGPGRVAWIEAEVAAWIETRTAERDGRAA